MPRLIAGAAGKRKFWHGYVAGTELTVHFGRIGKVGDTQVKAFDTPDKAAKELAKLVKQKLAKGYTDDGWRMAVPGGALELVRIDDLPPHPESIGADEDELIGSYGHITPRHGDYALGLQQSGDKYITGLVDRSSGTVVWRPFEPAISPPELVEWGLYMERTFPWAFDFACGRLIICDGVTHVIDCKSGKRTQIAADGVAAVAFVGDFAALLRAGRLELYAFARGKWTLAKTLPCGKQRVLHSFASGAGLIVACTDDARGAQYYLGFKGDEARVLGSNASSRSGITFETGGKSYFVTDYGVSEVLEIQHIAEAFEQAFAGDYSGMLLRDEP